MNAIHFLTISGGEIEHPSTLKQYMAMLEDSQRLFLEYYFQLFPLQNSLDTILDNSKVVVSSLPVELEFILFGRQSYQILAI